MERVATSLGLFPLPDDAKDALADLKGSRTGDLISGDEGADVAAAYDRAREQVLARQAEAGLDRVVEGQLRWDDMLAHPLCVHDAVRTAGVVRYYDNNNFYRDPVVEGELDFDGDVAGELEAAAALTDDLAAVIPGPYSLFDLATDDYYGDDADFLAALGEFLAGEVAAFPEATETLFVLDPSLVTAPPDTDLDERASEALDAVADATDADVVVHAPWGALEDRVYAHVLDAAVDAVGHDFVTAPEANLELVAEYGAKESVGLGVVDGQNTLVESADTIRARADWFEDALPPTASFERSYLTPNTELFYLPVNRFREKLTALGAATREVPA